MYIAIEKEMEGRYSKGTSTEVEFECEEISIDINLEGVTECGWTLLPLNPPVVIINCVVFSAMFTLIYISDT